MASLIREKKLALVYPQGIGGLIISFSQVLFGLLQGGLSQSQALDG